ncbi:MAG TPA: L-histidine N(alpha)-methyltransferase [Chitinophagales bacterium]|nr:L-histidine N(alpha)-methyltransferase [Chitinophagales bacterium]
MENFLQNVLKGLQSAPKYLDSKYFYDKKGDELFQKIMASEEYYLTDSEMEIFTTQTSQIADSLLKENTQLDVIEFGAGDATKSSYLLKELLNRKAIGTYLPIDISENIIELLYKTLPIALPGLKIHGMNGEYFSMLSKANTISTNRKVVLFLGANIGNFKFNEMAEFCQTLHNKLSEGDLILIGFDLKKHPRKIRNAYDDARGFTRQFNLNLLNRINNELQANFDINQFDHYASYDPDNGACKSYLVSLKDQDVCIAENNIFHFKKNETIFMEISQKYSIDVIERTALESGFTPVAYFFDSNNYFTDVIWRVTKISKKS